MTSIGNYTFRGCSSLPSINLPEGVTSVGNYAFSDCSSLTSITLPEGVTSVGNYAFEGCSSLTSITLPEGVTSVGNYAFRGCNSLTSANIPESVENIGNYVYNDCSNLSSITILAGVTNIGYSPFKGCNNLKSVYINDLSQWCKIPFESYDQNPLNYAHHLYVGEKEVFRLVVPSDITEIKPYSFYGASAIVSATLPDGVTNIGKAAFHGCDNLASINIPEGITAIGSSAFYGCSSLTSIVLPKDLTSIDYRTFSGCSNLATITIPEKVKTIGEWAFYGCSKLNTINIPASVTDIGSYAFSSCGGLNSVLITNLASWNSINFGDISANPLYMAKHLYLNGEELMDLVIPSGSQTVGEFTYQNCLSFKTITIPKSVEVVYANAFNGCTNLESVTVKATTPPFLYDNSFSKWDRTLYVPASTKSAYEAADGWKNFTEIVELEAQKFTLEISGNFNSSESHLYDRDGKEYDVTDFAYNEFDEGSYIRISPFIAAALYIQEIVVNGESVGTWTEDNAPTEFVIESLSENTTVEFKTYLRAQWRTLGCIAEGPGKVEMYKNGNLIGTTSSPENYFSDVLECGDVIKLVLVPDAGSTLTQFLGGEYSADEALHENLLGEITDNAYSFTFNPDDIVNKYGYLMRFFKATFEGPEPSTNNTLSAAAPTILTGKTAPLSLSLANEDDIIMTEFYIQLPEGITIEEDEDGYPKVTLNSERSNNHSLEVSRNSEGLYHFLVFSSRNYALKGHEGELFSMNLVCAEGVAAGTYQATVKNILLSDPNKNEITPSDFTFDVTVMDVAMGDANGDGRINGMDIVEMVDYIMERPSDTFVFAAADLTADQKVNGMDLVELVSLVMAQGAASPQLLTKGKGAQMPHHFDSGLTLTSHDDGSLTLGVEKSDAFILAQMIVEVDGGQLTDVTTDTKHEVAWRQIGENRYAVLAYSTKNCPFAANDELLKLYFANDANSIRVTDVMLASAEREERRFESVACGSATGINSIGDSEWANGGSVYDLQGRKVMSTLPRKGIYIMNGKKVVRK